MSGLIDQLQTRTSAASGSLRVLDVDAEETDDVLDALATDTRRSVYRALFEEPRTASELADCADTSVQNVHYHLSTLKAAGLVEVVDTTYSEKGNEMTVYGPGSDPIVIVGDDRTRPRIERTLTDVVGGLGFLGVAALLVQWGADRLSPAPDRSGAAGPAGLGTGTGDRGIGAWLLSLATEPGVLFFVGTLLIALLVVFVRNR